MMGRCNNLLLALVLLLAAVLRARADDCDATKCKNGATCVDVKADDGAFTCSCAAGFSGATCAVDIDECASSPCQNGGACTDSNDSGAVAANAFKCACVSGYSGNLCQVNITDCAAAPCKNGATCVDGVVSFSCSCATGWSGATCTSQAAPSSFAASRQSSSSISLSWTAPPAGDSAITAYRLYRDGALLRTVGAATTQVLGGLNHTTGYSLKVAAVSAAGESAASAALAKSTAPGSPKPLVAQTVAKDSILLAWAVPTAKVGGAAVTGSQLRSQQIASYVSNSSFNANAATTGKGVAGSTKSYSASPGDVWQFSVRKLYSAAGTSEASEVLTVKALGGCSSFVSAYSCIGDPRGLCGWCSTDKLCYQLPASGVSPVNAAVKCAAADWLFPAAVVQATSGAPSAGFVPSAAVITKRQSASVALSFKVNNPAAALDLFFLHDTRDGIADSLPEVVTLCASAVPNVLSVRCGGGAFSARPTPPLGLAGDSVFTQMMAVGTNASGLVAALHAHSGQAHYVRAGLPDNETGLLETLISVANSTKSIGWRAGAKRMVVVSSNHPYQVSRKVCCDGSAWAPAASGCGCCSGDCHVRSCGLTVSGSTKVLDWNHALSQVQCAAAQADGGVWGKNVCCGGGPLSAAGTCSILGDDGCGHTCKLCDSDTPTVIEVRAALLREGIIPVFLSQTAHKAPFEKLIADLGFGFWKSADDVTKQNCGFEADFCGWTGVASFWHRGSSTPTAGTGPSAAASGRSFAFVESSGGNRNNVGYLTSPALVKPTRVTFYYHMHGSGSGTLELETVRLTEAGQVWESKWSKAGKTQTTSSGAWTKVVLSIPDTTTAVRFKATTGAGAGDIAVDAVAIESPTQAVQTAVKAVAAAIHGNVPLVLGTGDNIATLSASSLAPASSATLTVTGRVARFTSTILVHALGAGTLTAKVSTPCIKSCAALGGCKNSGTCLCDGTCDCQATAFSGADCQGPKAPAVGVVSQTATSASFKWTPPSFSGTVTGYQVHHDGAGTACTVNSSGLNHCAVAPKLVHTIGTGGRTVTLTGLSSGTLHSFTWTTTPGGTAGPKVLVSTATGPPLNLKAVSRTSSELLLSWDLPKVAAGAATPTSTTVYYSEVGNAAVKSFIVNSPSATTTLKSLTPGAGYEVWVLATAAAGASASSAKVAVACWQSCKKACGAKSQVTCANSGVCSASGACSCGSTGFSGVDCKGPPKVGRPVLVAADASSVELKWVAPTIAGGGAALSGYRVYRDGVLAYNGAGSLTKQIKVGRLGAGMPYAFTVEALCSDGAGDASDALSTSTAPGAPASLRLLLAGTTSFSASWSLPSIGAGAAAVSNSELHYRKNGTARAWTKVQAVIKGATASATATALSPRVFYNVKVTGSSAQGQGAFSASLLVSTTANCLQEQTDKCTWRKIASPLVDYSGADPSLFSHQGAVVGGSELLVAGGLNGALRDNTLRYNLTSDSWAYAPAKHGVLPPRYGHASAELSAGVAAVFGGVSGVARLDDMWVWDSASGWNQKARGGAWPSARSGHSLAFGGGGLLLFGGETDAGVSNELWQYDPVGGSFVKRAKTGAWPSARTQHSAVVLKDQLLIYGGDGPTGRLNDIWALNVSSSNWKQIKPLVNGVLPKLTAHSAVAHGDGAMLVFGGSSGYSEGSDAVFKLDVASNCFSRLGATAGAAPAARFEHSAASMPDAHARTQMVVTGGRSFANTSQLSDAWVCLINTSAPAPPPPPPCAADSTQLCSLLKGRCGEAKVKASCATTCCGK